MHLTASFTQNFAESFAGDFSAGLEKSASAGAVPRNGAVSAGSTVSRTGLDGAESFAKFVFSCPTDLSALLIYRLQQTIIKFSTESRARQRKFTRTLVRLHGDDWVHDFEMPPIDNPSEAGWFAESLVLKGFFKNAINTIEVGGGY